MTSVRIDASPRTRWEKWTATFGCTVSGWETLLFLSLVSFCFSSSKSEIPGSTNKETPSWLETNEVAKNRPILTDTASSKSPTFDDAYELYEEVDEEISNTRYVSITNPTRTTANGQMKHVPTVGVARKEPHPAVFLDPELILNSGSIRIVPIAVNLFIVAVVGVRINAQFFYAIY